jgi:hypothetical protein
VGKEPSSEIELGGDVLAHFSKFATFDLSSDPPPLNFAVNAVDNGGITAALSMPYPALEVPEVPDVPDIMNTTGPLNQAMGLATKGLDVCFSPHSSSLPIIHSSMVTPPCREAISPYNKTESRFTPGNCNRMLFSPLYFTLL